MSRFRPNGGVFFVITSYSIHYTKLYDAGHGVAVLLLVELDPHVLETLEGLLADQPAHFTDTCGEHHRVEAAERRAIGADVLLEAVPFDLQRQLAAIIPSYNFV